MKLRRLRKAKKGRIEIIPMIDVMFFLLATFMIASLSMQHLDAVPVNLAHSNSSKAIDEEALALTINSKNEVFLNKALISESDIVLKLKPLLQSNDKVIVYADKQAFQGVVTNAMLKAREAGAKHFSIIVKGQ